MSTQPDCPLARALAQQMRAQRRELVLRWLERITARVSLDRNRIFPTEELLDHIPLLVDGIADYLEDPGEEVCADSALLEKALELGKMRHGQRFEVHEILKEYEILGNILFHFLTTVADRVDQPCTRGQMLACGHRLHRAVAVIQEVTLVEYMRLARVEVAEREERLRGFNRALSHEVRNRLGALRGAVDMLGEPFIREDEAQRERFQSMATQNLDGIDRTMTNLIELSRMAEEVRQQRNVLLPQAVFEASRQLRSFGESRNVEVRISDELPNVEVPASVVELAITNYLSNAIKYHDPRKDRRWVEIRGWTQNEPGDRNPEIVVAVSDNGLGVPLEAREHLFSRFYRGHATSSPDVEGTGLGLSIVRDAIESVGGRAWVDLDNEGETVFAFSLPSRRASDLAASQVIDRPM